MAHFHPAILALAATACFATGLAHGQDVWPAKTVTIIVPAAPGGTTDIVTRLLADGLSREWGQVRAVAIRTVLPPDLLMDTP